MDESRTADAQAINQATASRIPVRSISLAIVVTVVMYVGMATLADWEAFGAAVSALPGSGGALPPELSPSVCPLASFHRCSISSLHWDTRPLSFAWLTPYRGIRKNLTRTYSRWPFNSSHSPLPPNHTSTLSTHPAFSASLAKLASKLFFASCFQVAASN